jgi:uncharacterized protein YbcI
MHDEPFPKAEDRSAAGRAPAESLSSSVSNAVVQIFAAHVGRGPTKARTVVARDLITVVLEETFTTAERTLIERGGEEAVLELRRAAHVAMRDRLVEAVEAISGRRVLACLGDQQTDPDIAVETFVLAPVTEEERGLTRPAADQS